MSDMIEISFDVLDGLVLAALKRQHEIVSSLLSEDTLKLLTAEDESERAYLRQNIEELVETTSFLSKSIAYYGGSDDAVCWAR
jgi:hypothetical protein